MSDPQPEPEGGSSRFVPTRWSMVLAARRPGNGDSAAALTWLCERYWFPLFAHARRCGRTPEEAEDSVQAFFERMLRGEMLDNVDAERGRFRSYLLGCFNHTLAHQRRHDRRLKRGGGAEIVSIDHASAEARLQRELVDQRSPDLDFDRMWAFTLLDRVLSQLATECDANGNDGHFAVLKTFIQGDRGEQPMLGAAARLGISLAALKSKVHRLRGRFRALVQSEVRETVENEAALPAEMDYLFSILSR